MITARTGAVRAGMVKRIEMEEQVACSRRHFILPTLGHRGSALLRNIWPVLVTRISAMTYCRRNCPKRPRDSQR